MKPTKTKKSRLPSVSPNELRRELYKYYYGHSIEKFDLFSKADASEFLTSALELFHFCLNQNENKVSVDDKCGVVDQNQFSKK
mmetsp:Transcript_2345/g.3528  ORF Transcript_2345/g.3528 Transcript_2345/m.3528 type:complete len:83 (-) Transcript_2345:187-435(-)